VNTDNLNIRQLAVAINVSVLEGACKQAKQMKQAPPKQLVTLFMQASRL
jgi:hypothetical protein